MQAELFFDPVCPFCWVTARWVRQVQRVRDLDVRWRFISLTMLNEGRYEGRPEGYPEAHRNGLRLLRIAAAARHHHGESAVGPLYEAMGDRLWETPLPDELEDVEDGFARVLAFHVQRPPYEDILDAAGLSRDLVTAADDPSWDDILRAETDEALDRVGGDVGTPIISLDPPDGPAFFGPVIAAPPDDDEDAGRYWDAMVTLAGWPGFAELKRTLRHFPVTQATRHLVDETTTRIR